MRSRRRKRHLWIWIALATVILLVVIRMLAPAFILKQVNQDLATISPIYSIHIDDLHLSLLRMFYRFTKIEGKLKKSNKQFLSIERIDVAVAWAELLKGRVFTNVEVDKGTI